MQAQKLSVKDICLIGIFTAIICVVGQMSIPMPYGVPITLQTLIIPIAGLVLGVKLGTIACLTYISIGAIGLPVFAGFTGGLGSFIGPGGGFILSFPILALTAGIASKKTNPIFSISWLLLGMAVNLLCGMFFFSVVMKSNIQTAFTACVLPFIPTTIIKTAILALLNAKIKKYTTSSL